MDLEDVGKQIATKGKGKYNENKSAAGFGLMFKPVEDCEPLILFSFPQMMGASAWDDNSSLHGEGSIQCWGQLQLREWEGAWGPKAGARSLG